MHVDFEHIAEEVKRHGYKPWAYVSRDRNTTLVTVGSPESRTVVQAETTLGPEEAKKLLTEQGLLVAPGRWVPDPFAGELHIAQPIWVTAVAYRTQDEKPGLWVDASRSELSVGDVLRDFYEEMGTETDLSTTSLDEFIVLTNPNVVVLGPDQLAAFAD